MLMFQRPTDGIIREYLEARLASPFTYAQVGASRGKAPQPGYNTDHCRVLLGRG